MTRRHNSKRRANSPEAVADSLPPELRSFDSWYYPHGLNDYMRELSRFVGEDQRVSPVMNAAGLSAADWFRRMLTDEIHDIAGTRRRVVSEVVKDYHM